MPVVWEVRRLRLMRILFLLLHFMNCDVSFTYSCLMALQKGFYKKSKHSPRRGDLCSAFAHLSVMSCFSQLRWETCIICNRYRSLMYLLSPPATHNGSFLKFLASCSTFDGDGMGTVRVTWEETRRTLGPFIYSTCQEDGIVSAWHGMHTECACPWSGSNERKRWPSKGKLDFRMLNIKEEN